MTSPALPACGLYRTLLPIGDLEAGRLVYFHNHGNPGAGVYFPGAAYLTASLICAVTLGLRLWLARPRLAVVPAAAKLSARV